MMTTTTLPQSSGSVIFDGLNVAAMTRDQMERTRQGGVHAINFTAFPIRTGFDEAMAEARSVRDNIVAMADVATVATSVEDIVAARKNGRVGVVLGSQNAGIVGEDLSRLGAMHTLGLRIMQPSHNPKNLFGCGAACLGDEDTGVTPLGFDWLAETERLNIVVDVSHCGHRSTSDFLVHAKRPAICSHANAHDLFPSPRNKTDAMLRRIADLGGVTGAVMYTPAVRGDRWPTLDDFIDHIAHITNVAGIDHVGFATDISDGIDVDPENWAELWGPAPDDPVTSFVGDWYGLETERLDGYHSLADTPKLIARLEQRGFSAGQIEKIMGGNFLRVFRDVWGR